jgi:alkanesulfonate monooxygenase SsuD/methylene tetrahydromethanopterin reductase-like flavin-dependent oxidoreductase (luciferase family)
MFMNLRHPGYIAGTPEECLRRIEEYVALGVTHFVIRFGDIPSTDGIQVFADQVIK